jgi:hypothetical protein
MIPRKEVLRDEEAKSLGCGVISMEGAGRDR